MALYHFSAKVFSRSSRNTVRAIAYRAGCKLYNERTGQTFNYEEKPVQHVELALPKDAPSWARDIQELMKSDRQKGVQAFCDVVEVADDKPKSVTVPTGGSKKTSNDPMISMYDVRHRLNISNFDYSTTAKFDGIMKDLIDEATKK